MGFADKLKAKAEELGLMQKAQVAKEKAAAAADQNREKIAELADKAGQTVNEKTDGKYSQHIDKAKGAALKGVDAVAAQGGEDAAQRTAGQDGMATSDAAGTGESSVQRAVGADASTSSLDPNSPDRIASEQPEHLGDANAAQNTAQPGENEPSTDPEINDPHATPKG